MNFDFNFFQGINFRSCSIKSIAMIVLFVILLLLPITMGQNSNSRIPIIGTAERISHEYCETNLKRTVGAFAVGKALDKVIELTQDLQLSIGVPVLNQSIDFKPGKMLSPISDSLKRICSILFTLIEVMLIGKMAIGITFFLGLKFLIPLGLFLIIITLPSAMSRYRKRLQSTGKNLISLGLMITLFFPVMAFLGGYVENHFIKKEMNTTMSLLKDENSMPEDMREDLATIEKQAGETVKSAPTKKNSNIKTDSVKKESTITTESENKLSKSRLLDKLKGNTTKQTEPLEQITEGDQEKNLSEKFKESMNGIGGSFQKLLGKAKNLGTQIGSLITFASTACERLMQIIAMMCIVTFIIPLFVCLIFRKLWNSLDFSMITGLFENTQPTNKK